MALRAGGHYAEAEASISRAIAMAQTQSARYWELRAKRSLVMTQGGHDAMTAAAHCGDRLVDYS